MEFKSVKKVHSGKFITRYDLEYETVDHKTKIYEMISRKKDLETLDDIKSTAVDAVVLIIHNKEKDKLLLNKEFRLAVGDWVYNFPAGLIDEGEEPEESAKRELKEETGLDLISIEDTIGESYSAVGFSNEKNVCIVGTATGEIAESDSTFEEIEAAWYSKEEIRELLKEGKFAARTQAYCYMWSRM